MKATTIALAGAVLLRAVVVQAEPAASGALTVRLTQLRSNDGQVGCMVFSTAKGFPTDPTAATQRKWCAILEKSAGCVFDPMPAGIYAAACFHDENKNGKLDTGLFGIPKEGTVASNEARGWMGPPSFDKAKFQFGGADASVTLRMSY